MFRYLFLLLFIGMLSFPSPSEGKEPLERITISVKSSPYAKFETKLEIENEEFLEEIIAVPKEKVGTEPELPFGYLTVHINDKEQHYTVSYALNLFDVKNGTKLKLPQETKDRLLSYIQLLNQHHYGHGVSWKEASRLFPRKGYAEVVDMETGKRFNVQRRAGSQHADVQPLTAEDTKVMKEIYNGKWSWKRRAILVRTGGQTLSGSMHGMPHGAGAISHNNFPGHFCIHFKDSTTHRRDVPDPGHDLMISKASGELFDRIIQGTPEEIIQMFVTAIHEQDESVVKLMMNRADIVMVQAFMHRIGDIEGIQLAEIQDDQNKALPYMREISVKLKLKRIGQKEEHIVTRFVLTREGATDRWKVEMEPILEQWS